MEESSPLNTIISCGCGHKNKCTQINDDDERRTSHNEIDYHEDSGFSNKLYTVHSDLASIQISLPDSFDDTIPIK